MVSTVFLKTNKFEVKLEGIKYKAIDFEPFHIMDLLFRKGKVWRHPPVVGIDVMHHPRDPRMALLFLSFGIGCVILGFRLGEELPRTIMDFLGDERIVFAGFGVPEKIDMFPFERLGLFKNLVDVGYLASEIYNDESLRKCELAELARKVLGIRSMVGLTRPGLSSKPARIKCTMCEVFISTVIAMTLEKKRNCNSERRDTLSKKKVPTSLKRIIKLTTLYRKSLSKKMTTHKIKSSLNSPKSTPRNHENIGDVGFHQCLGEDAQSEAGSTSNGQLKSILKSPYGSCSNMSSLRRNANTKGYNVSFKDELVE